MASNWIALYHTLRTHPKTKSIHRKTGAASIQETIGRLVCVWWLADAHSSDGDYGGTVEDIDEEAGFDGFALVMQEVGWLKIEDTRIVFPKFGDHNGKTAKGRLLDAKRKRVSRSKTPGVRPMSAPCPAPTGQEADHRTEQNSTEQDKKSKSLADARQTDEFEAWWVSYPPRRGKRGNKGEARAEWNKLTDQQRGAVVAATSALAAEVSRDPSTLPKDAQRFLRTPNKSANADPSYVEWLDIEPPPAKVRSGDQGKYPGDPDIIAKLIRRGAG